MSASLPSSVLFACSQNSVRSPMAEAMAKRLYGQSSYIDAVGVRTGNKIVANFGDPAVANNHVRMKERCATLWRNQRYIFNHGSAVDHTV